MAFLRARGNPRGVENACPPHPISREWRGISATIFGTPPETPDTPADDLTAVLRAAQEGDAGAAARLLPLVYGELRRLARARMARLPRLLLFAGHCERRGLAHPEIAAYPGRLWRFIGMPGSAEAFRPWT